MDQISDAESLKLFLANAPGQPLVWERFLAELIRELNCDSSILLVTDLSDSSITHFLFSNQVNDEYRELYENRLNRLDSFNHFASKNPYRVFYNETVEGLAMLGPENDFVPPDNQHYRFGVSVPCNHKHALSLLVNRKTAFSVEEQDRANKILQSIVSPLEDAVHAEQRHKIDKQLRHQLGGHFDAYIIVDQKLNILFSDPILISIIAQMDCVRVSDKRFGMTHPGMEQQLLSLIENNQVVNIPNHCHSCRIVLTPIASLNNLYQWECFKDGYILTFTYNKEKNPVIDRLTDIYHLSRCEAVCAMHFMHTPSITEIAASTFRSQETVRNHIKHIMQKMEVHSQAELMKKLITLASLD
ncbi:MAG: helix-turn-helix transcriptional regulator [Gammaproteobacteria bacterium]